MAKPRKFQQQRNEIVESNDRQGFEMKKVDPVCSNNTAVY